MRRHGGWTLIELLIAITVFGTVSATALGVFRSVHDEERLSAAYAQDVTGLRRAVNAVERDLRGGADRSSFPWRLEAGTLYRKERAVARNVAHFDVAWDEDLVTVTVALGPRTDARQRRDAVVTTQVARRPPGAQR